MHRKTLIWCTAAIMVTLIGCSWWIHASIEDNTRWILRALEH